jgi:hypothetical protein
VNSRRRASGRDIYQSNPARGNPPRRADLRTREQPAGAIDASARRQGSTHGSRGDLENRENAEGSRKRVARASSARRSAPRMADPGRLTTGALVHELTDPRTVRARCVLAGVHAAVRRCRLLEAFPERRRRTSNPSLLPSHFPRVDAASGRAHSTTARRVSGVHRAPRDGRHSMAVPDHSCSGLFPVLSRTTPIGVAGGTHPGRREHRAYPEAVAHCCTRAGWR